MSLYHQLSLYSTLLLFRDFPWENLHIICDWESGNFYNTRAKVLRSAPVISLASPLGAYYPSKSLPLQNLCDQQGQHWYQQWLFSIQQGPVEDIARVYNTHLVIDDKGEIQRKYRKTHLFDVEISGGAIMKESEYVIPGEEMVNPVKTPAGNVSLQIVSFSVDLSISLLVSSK